jgi:hypothetical protein
MVSNTGVLGQFVLRQIRAKSLLKRRFLGLYVIDYKGFEKLGVSPLRYENAGKL